MFEDFSHPLLPYTVSVNARGDILRNYGTVSEQGSPADLLLAEVYRDLQELKKPSFASNPLAEKGVGELASVDTAIPGAVNVNTASPDDLEALPYIGKSLALKIINLRKESPFVDTADLVKRTGLKISDFGNFGTRVFYG